MSAPDACLMGHGGDYPGPYLPVYFSMFVLDGVLTATGSSLTFESQAVYLNLPAFHIQIPRLAADIDGTIGGGYTQMQGTDLALKIQASAADPSPVPLTGSIRPDRTITGQLSNAFVQVSFVAANMASDCIPGPYYWTLAPRQP